MIITSTYAKDWWSENRISKWRQMFENFHKTFVWTVPSLYAVSNSLIRHYKSIVNVFYKSKMQLKIDFQKWRKLNTWLKKYSWSKSFCFYFQVFFRMFSNFLHYRDCFQLPLENIIIIMIDYRRFESYHRAEKKPFVKF